jgi:uncharacterized membrane protein HdeD (DUF308 family)
MAGKTLAGLQKQWGWFFALGILLILFGFLIIMFPVAGTFVVETLFGILLLIAGIAQIVTSFQVRRWGGFLFSLLVGILYGGAGLVLLLYPLSGVITLTLFLGLFLLVDGVLRGGLAFRLKPAHHWRWVMFDAIITLLLGILIIANWPSDSLWVIGLLFGINLLFSGLTSVMLSFAARETR